MARLIEPVDFPIAVNIETLPLCCNALLPLLMTTDPPLTTSSSELSIPVFPAVKKMLLPGVERESEELCILIDPTTKSASPVPTTIFPEVPSPLVPVENNAAPLPVLCCDDGVLINAPPD